MIRFFIKQSQLHNFFHLKEPIVFLAQDNMMNDVVEVYVKAKRLKFTEYKTYISVELDTFGKKVKRWIKRKK